MAALLALASGTHQLLSRESPPLVILPLALDLQIPLSETLQPKTQALDESNRSDISGDNIGLDPVEAQVLEGVEHGESKRLSHESLSNIGESYPVAEIAALEAASADLIEVHCTDNLIICSRRDEEAPSSLSRSADEDLIECLGAIRIDTWRGQGLPGSKESLAHTTQRQVAVPIPLDWKTQLDPLSLLHNLDNKLGLGE